MTYIDEMIKELCPDGVEWKELGDPEVAKLSRGKVMSKQFLEENKGEFPVYSSQTANNGEIGKISSFDFDGEYITWTTDGANAGTVFYRQGKFSITNVCGIVDIKCKELLPKFVYYFLTITTKKHVSSGMGNPKLMSNVMAKIKVPIPPLEIQQEIVQILDKFTEYVTELTAELTFRQKQYEYYREAIIGFKTQKHQFVCLSDISSYSKEKIVNTQIPKGNYIGVENLLQNKRGFVKKEFELAPGNSTMFSPGSTLIGNIRPYLKKILYADFFGGTNDDVLVVDILDSCKEFVDSKYLYYCLSSDYFFNFMNQNSRGAKMPRGDKNKIMEFELPLPSLEEQNQIVMTLDKFESLVYSIQDGLPKLIEEQQKQYAYYRQNLLGFDEMEGK